MRKLTALPVMLATAVAVAGCGGSGDGDVVGPSTVLPTAAPLTARQQYAVERVVEYAGRLAIPTPPVGFEMPPLPTNPPAGGWTVPGLYKVFFNRWWIDEMPAPQDQVSAMAAHEVCHLTVADHDEEAAEACKARLLGGGR